MSPRFILLPALAVLLLCAAERKKPEVTVRFHLETGEADGEKFAMPVFFNFARKKAFVSKVPVLNEKDIVAIYPFRGPDGTEGVTLYLNVHGRMSLDTLSIEGRGKSLLVLVNGRQILDILIDRRVSDGILTVPFGLTPEEIALLTQQFRIAGTPPTR